MLVKDMRGGCVIALLLPCLLAGCYIKVDKGKHGEDNYVEVRMPLGGVQVHQSAPSSADMGLPTYPEASVIEDKYGNSANVHVGFGNWQITVRVAKYQAGDPQTKVTSFYRAALGQYGAVLACQDGHAVGSPSVTQDGLGCDDKHGESKGIPLNDDGESGFTLRAGSRSSPPCRNQGHCHWRDALYPAAPQFACRYRAGGQGRIGWRLA